MNSQSGMEMPILSELPTISDKMTFLYLEHCRTFPRICGGDPAQLGTLP